MDRNIVIDMPKGVKRILDIFQSNGFEAYAVGGCVRDSILGRKPEDWDITTNALPEDTMKLLGGAFKVIPTGLKHGTLTLLDGAGSSYEVTTYRIDGDYSDGRHPDEVSFTTSLREDLSRRDFTINALAYSDKTGIVDYFKGLRDIEKRIIRCVGDADKRFREDALRMMRGIRFAAQLGFEIEDNTKISILHNSDLIKNVSIERIQQEFNKIIIKDPLKLKDLWESGLMKHFLPEYGLCIGLKQNHPYHIYTLDEHLLESMCHIDAQVDLRLIMLFHDIGKPLVKSTDEKGIDHFYNHEEISSREAEKILKRMRYDNKTIEKIKILIKYHDTVISGKKGIRKLLSLMGEENLREFFKVKEADMLAQNREFYQKGHEGLEKIKKMLDEIIEEQDCFTLKDLKINGNDLKSIGFKPDRRIGETLNLILDAVIENPELNEREKLLEYALKLNVKPISKEDTI